MPSKKPIKPSQFSESFQFIQSLFQEDETRFEKNTRKLRTLIRYLTRVFFVITSGLVIWFIWEYQVEAFVISNQGLLIPYR